MPDYRRPVVPSATVFFTVTLMDRGSRLLMDEVGRLREAVRATRAERPFRVEAWVVLPDHLHAVWNPVKHGLVERPEDWPLSSFHRDMRP